jgi:hypothetical protein
MNLQYIHVHDTCAAHLNSNMMLMSHIFSLLNFCSSILYFHYIIIDHTCKNETFKFLKFHVHHKMLFVNKTVYDFTLHTKVTDSIYEVGASQLSLKGPGGSMS